MTDPISLGFWAVVWVLTAAAIQLIRWKTKAVGAGLVLAYMLNLWLLHWIGSAIYLLPWYENRDIALIEAGFRQSTYAIIAFGVGSVVLAPILVRMFELPGRGIRLRQPDPRLPRLFVAVGLLSYVVLLPIAGRLPSATSLVAAGGNLLVVGLALACWKAWHNHRRESFLLWLAAIIALPFLTIITQGFVSYGLVAFMTLFAFIETFYRPSRRFVAIGLVVAYVGLSVFVGYTRDREAIRAVVFGGEGFGSRLARVYFTLSDFEWFDPSNDAHLRRIDGRLNQNFLIGTATDYLGGRFESYAQGDTLVEAAISLVPRALWPDKPVTAGSGGLVSRYTGIPFAEGTSVGIGQVMEFFVNFGTAGVILGFLVIGVIITTVDVAAGRRLAFGDLQGFTLRYLPGLSLLQAGGSLVEVVSSAGAGMVIALIVMTFPQRAGGARG